MSSILTSVRRFAPWIAIAVGAVLAVLGVLSRTVWAPDPLWTASLKPTEDTRLVLSDPGVLDLLAADVTVTATVVDADDLAAADEEDPDDEELDGEGETAADEDGAEESGGEADADAEEAGEPGVVISIARDVDALGWVGEAAALRITGLATEEGLASTEITGDLESAAVVDSDLWWHVDSGADSAQLEWQKEPGRWSVVIASSNDKKISSIDFTWPQSTATPAATPLILVGAFIILIGAALLLFPQLLDKTARARLATSLKERTSAAHPTTAADAEHTDSESALVESAEPVESERLGAEPAEPERDDPARDPDPEDTAESGSAEPDAAQPDAAQPDAAEPGSADSGVTADTPAVSPVARFTPGTMTRRQIRELERARREAARAQGPGSGRAATAAASEPTPQELLAELAAQQDSPEGGQSSEAQSTTDQTTPVRRSDQWRKTWGFIPDEQFSAQTNAWLPEEVSDEEGESEK